MSSKADRGQMLSVLRLNASTRRQVGSSAACGMGAGGTIGRASASMQTSKHTRRQGIAVVLADPSCRSGVRHCPGLQCIGTQTALGFKPPGIERRFGHSRRQWLSVGHGGQRAEAHAADGVAAGPGRAGQPWTALSSPDPRRGRTVSPHPQGRGPGRPPCRIWSTPRRPSTPGGRSTRLAVLTWPSAWQRPPAVTSSAPEPCPRSSSRPAMSPTPLFARSIPAGGFPTRAGRSTAPRPSAGRYLALRATDTDGVFDLCYRRHVPSQVDLRKNIVKPVHHVSEQCKP